MKNTLLKPFIALSFLITLCSCEDDDLLVPDLSLNEQENSEESLEANDGGDEAEFEFTHFTNTPLSDIEKLYQGEILEFASSSLKANEMLTSGFVISSDASQNITQQIYIQDQAENPTMGVVIHVTSENIDQDFNIGIGHEIQLKLEGLGLQKINNIFHIGKFTNGALTAIPNEEFENYILKTIQTKTIIPKTLTVTEILQTLDPESAYEPFHAILVTVENVQLIEGELGTSYGQTTQSQEKYKQVLKTLADCNDGALINLQTSSASTFSAVSFPENNGSITGILHNNRLIIRETDDVNFTQERCKIVSENTTEGLLFSENFETINTPEELIALEGWKNINTAEDIPVYWLANTLKNNVFAEIRKGGENEAYESWLITKPIEINTTRQLKLSLDIHISDRNSDNLEIFIIDDVYDNHIVYSPENKINIVPQTNNTSTEFTKIETLFSIPENMHHFRIGFRYKKIIYPNLSATTAYKIDNILVTEE